MFVPLHDENRLRSIRFQYVTVALIAVNVIVYLLEISGMDEATIASFALIPVEFLTPGGAPGGATGVSGTAAIPEALTPLTYMFLHANFYHLAGNMLFLWVFGDNVEDAMGHARFLVFYLVCGVAAGLVHAFVTNSGLTPTLIEGGESGIVASEAPLIGASGAVAGVIAAYLMLHPRVRVWVLALKAIPLRISAFFALGLWILMQLVMVLTPQAGPVAWWAHIGGLVAGAVLIVFLRRPGVRLFDRDLSVA